MLQISDWLRIWQNDYILKNFSLYHYQKMGNINQIIWEMKKENKRSDPKLLNKFLWVMIGGAVWDALWAPFEFLRMGEFEREDGEYHDDGKFQEWERTDDTAMALLLADSLIRCKWFDIEDQLKNYYKWHKTWYMWLRDYPEWEWIQISKMMYFYEQYNLWAIYSLYRFVYWFLYLLYMIDTLSDELSFERRITYSLLLPY